MEDEVALGTSPEANYEAAKFYTHTHRCYFRATTAVNPSLPPPLRSVLRPLPKPGGEPPHPWGGEKGGGKRTRSLPGEPLVVPRWAPGGSPVVPRSKRQADPGQPPVFPRWHPGGPPVLGMGFLEHLRPKCSKNAGVLLQNGSRGKLLFLPPPYCFARRNNKLFLRRKE